MTAFLCTSSQKTVTTPTCLTLFHNETFLSVEGCHEGKSTTACDVFPRTTDEQETKAKYCYEDFGGISA